MIMVGDDRRHRTGVKLVERRKRVKRTERGFKKGVVELDWLPLSAKKRGTLIAEVLSGRKGREVWNTRTNSSMESSRIWGRESSSRSIGKGRRHG